MARGRKNYALGVDLGGTNIVCGIIDRKGNITIRRSRPTEAKKGGKAVLGNIKAIVKEVLETSPVERDHILAIGVGTPGAVDQETGRIAGNAPNLPGWEGIALVGSLEEEFGLPTVASNDVTVYALGEAVFGAGRGVRHLACLALGTGIGGGIIIDGKVYRGGWDCAAEIGHMTVDLNGRLCGCGSRGCIEAYASATAIAKRGREEAKKERGTLMLKLAGASQRIEAKTVFDAAREGDPAACRVVEEAGMYLGVGIANCINILNPEMLVIGGGVAQAGEILLQSIQEGLRRYALAPSLEGVKIVLAELGDNAAMMGAAALAFQEKGTG